MSFRDRRRAADRQFRQACESGVVAGFRPLVSAADCGRCQSVRGEVFPAIACTSDMLPPYPDCEYPDGCRGTFSFVLEGEYEELLREHPPGSGGEAPKRRGLFATFLDWISGGG